MDFSNKVYTITRAIPYGKVATYGQIAAAAGQARAARMVGIVMARCPSNVPWQRVINRHGMISIENMQVPKDEQARQLQAEGVEVRLVDGNYFIDLGTYLVDSQVLYDAVVE